MAIPTKMTQARAMLVIFCLLIGTINGKSLVLVGGGLRDDNDEIYGKVVELAGGPGVARIGVVTAASGDPVASADFYLANFLSYGAVETYWIPVHEGATIENRNPLVVDNINRMTGFFFGGGDQARIITSFYNNGREESPALAAIRQRYDEGAVVGGTSAGTVCQGSAVMIMDGMSYEALLHGAYPEGTEHGTDYLVYDPNGGIGFLDGYVLDSHFSERGREGRLVRLVSDTQDGPHGADYGLGVDEDTALVITNVGTATAVGEVIGASGVYLADLRSSIVTNIGGWRIREVFTDWLSAGDTLNMNTHINRHHVTFGSWKSNLAGNEYYDSVLTSDDIFNGNRGSSLAPIYVRVARSPFDTKILTETWGKTPNKNKPIYEVKFFQESTAQGYGGYDPVSGDWVISYTDLKIEMGPA